MTRLRNKPWAQEYIDSSKYCLKLDDMFTNRISNFFDLNKPIELELGMGKGDFLIEKARLNPEINFIGVEKSPSVAVMILKKLGELEFLPTNLLLIIDEISKLADYFNILKIRTIYINFPDPWPKSRHQKRRLISPEFLNDYYNWLAIDGKIIFKTDQKELFNYFLMQLKNSKQFKIVDKSTDLYANKKVLNQIKTEYEKKFIAQGIAINYLTIIKIRNP